ncbi:Na+/H+ antiporter NhaA [Chryseobacterium vietnamense]|uniref:Na+/H+ antiporter NhaA n=1 Tax=Chryseobacterium vietnamense TaxID=866785 RepID=UPI00286B7362|nr:Na+/H+ antiporter NhaA [Chryseobacterium vietnamense]
MALGLLLGKILGVVGFSVIFIRLKITQVPDGMNFRNLLGLGFLASIRSTMFLFFTCFYS